MSDAARIAKAVGGKPNGDGYMVRCPAHDDKQASLSIKDGDDGLLVNCFAGCGWKEIKDAFKRDGLLGDAVKKEETTAFKPVRLIVEKYDYKDDAGQLIHQTVRYMPKDFRQRRPDPNDPNNPDKWIWSIKGITEMPYRLADIRDADDVVICEGEKDADAVAAAGFAATTNAGGAKNWPEYFADFFTGKNVYIIPHNDAAGHDRNKIVADNILNGAKSVRVCPVAKDLGPKADAYDYLQDNELTLDQLRAFPTITDPVKDIVDTTDVFDVQAADDIRGVDTVDDFVESLLVCEAMSVVYGPSNCGKTFFASDIAMHVATARRWRDREVEQGGVLYVAAEGARGIRNRVLAYKQHNNVDHIPMGIIGNSINLLDPEGDVDTLINTIKMQAQKYRSIDLVVIDTLARVMAGGNENTAEDMGKLVVNCDRIRHATGAHVMVIHHSGKNAAAGARGSSALRAATDTEIEIEKNGSISCATVTKQRELEVEGTFAFELQVIELGTNHRGKSITSCVVEPCSADAAKRNVQLNDNQRDALTAVTNTIIESDADLVTTESCRVVHNEMRGSNVSQNAWSNIISRLVDREVLYRKRIGNKWLVGLR